MTTTDLIEAAPTVDQHGESTTPPMTRNQIIAKRAEEGEDLTAIGLDYEMSRERVRQIVEKTTTKTNDEIREARKQRREQARAEKDAARDAHIRQVAEAHPEATLHALVDLSGHSLAEVRAALDWTERERRADQQHYTSVADEVIFAELRRVAALDGGEPLTGKFYDEHRTGGLSHARLLQRFETWTAACTAAGVTPRGPNPGRTYQRRWTAEDMVGWVWRYLSSAEAPSYARFDQWLRTQPEAPSAQTIRNTVGSWVEMKRRAIETHQPVMQSA